MYYNQCIIKIIAHLVIKNKCLNIKHQINWKNKVLVKQQYVENKTLSLVDKVWIIFQNQMYVQDLTIRIYQFY